MSDALIIAIEVVLIQLYNTYMRYLPFSQTLEEKKKRRLLIVCLLWCIPSVLISLLIFHYQGLCILSYKSLYTFGWMPFFLFSYFIIRQRLIYHIFILGMQSMYFYCLHALSNILTGPLRSSDIAESIILQAGFYLLCEILFFPLFRYLFLHMMPSRQLINDRAYGYYIAFLPFFIGLSYAFVAMDDSFHGWDAMSSRFFLFVTFLLIARYVSLEKAEGARLQADRENNLLLQSQLHNLQDYTLLLKNSQTEFSVLRHDMRHHNRMLYTLLAEKKLDEAEHLLHKFDEYLDHTVLHAFCKNPILNAALSVYINRAQSLGIPIKYKIALPEKLSMEETDLAILLANLLENAILATQKLPPDSRSISLYLQKQGEQLLLSLENSSAEPLLLGDDGLPRTHEAGHGTGMVSLSLFVQKYQAFVSFSEENGKVRLSMQWHKPNSERGRAESE